MIKDRVLRPLTCVRGFLISMVDLSKKLDYNKFIDKRR